MDSVHADRYLRILEVPREKPSLEALRLLMRRHLLRLPFENVGILKWLQIDGSESGLDRWDRDRYLADIERWDHGGTCMLVAPHFFELLVSLGYDASLWLADIQSPVD